MIFDNVMTCWFGVAESALLSQDLDIVGRRNHRDTRVRVSYQVLSLYRDSFLVVRSKGSLST